MVRDCTKIPMNWYLYKKKLIYNWIHKYFWYGMKNFAIGLQIDPESYEWGSSARSVDLKWNP